MSSPGTIDLAERELQTVQKILQQHVPGRMVFVFGSRATGRARRHSDLDLAVSGAPLTLREDAILENAFDESMLPMKVDVISLAHASGVFRERIQAELIPFPMGESNAHLISERPVAA